MYIYTYINKGEERAGGAAVLHGVTGGGLGCGRPDTDMERARGRDEDRVPHSPFPKTRHESCGLCVPRRAGGHGLANGRRAAQLPRRRHGAQVGPGRCAPRRDLPEDHEGDVPGAPVQVASEGALVASQRQRPGRERLQQEPSGEGGEGGSLHTPLHYIRPGCLCTAVDLHPSISR
jgi:hypothetical protein